MSRLWSSAAQLWNDALTLRRSNSFTHLNSSAVDTEVVQKDGTVLLRPIPARGAGHTRTRRSKAAFSPKISHFDRNNTDSAQDPFRGFYTLFWLMVFVGMAKTGVRSWNEGGVVFGLSFARLIGRDGIALGLSDGVMVASTLLCVPFAQVSVRLGVSLTCADNLCAYSCFGKAGCGIAEQDRSFNISHRQRSSPPRSAGLYTGKGGASNPRRSS